jgi:ABC-type branched-subunit amino acid transport system substrate-binding protein
MRPADRRHRAPGKDDENGARLAVEEHTARKIKIGGKTVRFELMSEDDQADPKMGPTIAQKSSTQGRHVAGHLNSGVSIPASAVQPGRHPDVPARRRTRS